MNSLDINAACPRDVEELQQLVGELLATTEAVDVAQVMLQSFRRRLEQCIVPGLGIDNKIVIIFLLFWVVFGHFHAFLLC